MIELPLDQITKETIEEFVDNKVPEGRTLEYKQELPGNSDGDKKEFLADVSSFANAGGGDILYGINEERDHEGKTTGIPDRAEGLSISNVDAERLRLDSIIRSGLAPRIAFQIAPVDGFSNGPVLLIRVLQSWNGPHMVIFKNSSRFYSRTSAGKYQLDVSELRTAFTTSEALPERIQRFRDDRLARIVSDQTPVILQSGAKVVLHIVPLLSVRGQHNIDFDQLPNGSFGLMSPIFNVFNTRRFNIDGYLSSTSGSEGFKGYFQQFRDGKMESCDTSMLKYSVRDEQHYIEALPVENYIIAAIENYLQLLDMIHIGPPIVIMLSFLGVKDYKLKIPRRFFGYDDDHSIDRDLILLPDILIEDYSDDVATRMQPVFDALWQAAGWSRCLNYDPDGVRIET